MLEKTVQSLKTKKRSKKGFTLMEMLIVVAIIAILIAIAIPTFTSQLNSARVATDKANLRAAKSEAVTDYLSSSPQKTGAVTYGVTIDDKDNLTVADGGSGGDIGQSSTIKGTALTVTVTDGKVTSTTWDSALSGK